MLTWGFVAPQTRSSVGQALGRRGVAAAAGTGRATCRGLPRTFVSHRVLTLFQMVAALFQTKQSSLKGVGSVHVLFYLLLFFSSSDKKRKLEAKQEPKQNKKLKKNRDMKNKKDMKLKRKK